MEKLIPDFIESFLYQSNIPPTKKNKKNGSPLLNAYLDSAQVIILEQVYKIHLITILKSYYIFHAKWFF